MENELLPCPFCFGEAVFNAYDRLISIGCGKCGYTRGFKGLLTTEPHGKPVSREGAPVVEYYNKNAHKEAIEAWNTRAERTCTFDIDNGVDAYVCSSCGCYEYEPDVLNFNYCPNCGAKVVSE